MKLKSLSFLSAPLAAIPFCIGATLISDTALGENQGLDLTLNKSAFLKRYSIPQSACEAIRISGVNFEVPGERCTFNLPTGSGEVVFYKEDPYSTQMQLPAGDSVPMEDQAESFRKGPLASNKRVANIKDDNGTIVGCGYYISSNRGAITLIGKKKSPTGTFRGERVLGYALPGASNTNGREASPVNSTPTCGSAWLKNDTVKEVRFVSSSNRLEEDFWKGKYGYRAYLKKLDHFEDQSPCVKVTLTGETDEIEVHGRADRKNLSSA